MSTDKDSLRKVVGTAQAARAVMSTGFEAARLSTHLDWMGPFLNIDNFIMSKPTFAVHPHAGFSAVTVMFEDSEGTFRNRDSLGTDVLIPPGSIHWTQAGSGIFHEEVPTAAVASRGLQVFVALPEEHELAAPNVLHLEPHEVPIVETAEGHVRVLVGRHGTETSPLLPPGAPDGLFLFEVSVKPHSSLEVHPPSGLHTFALSLSGSGSVNNHRTVADEALGFDTEGSLRFTADEQGLRVIVAGGKPLGRPQVWNGGISTGSAERTQQLVQRLRTGAFKPF